MDLQLTKNLRDVWTSSIIWLSSFRNNVILSSLPSFMPHKLNQVKKFLSKFLDFSKWTQWELVVGVIVAIVLQAGVLYGCYRFIRYLLGVDNATTELPSSHSPMAISPAGRALLANLTPSGMRGKYQRLNDSENELGNLDDIVGGNIEMSESSSKKEEAIPLHNANIASYGSGLAAGALTGLEQGQQQQQLNQGTESVQGNIPYYMQPNYQYASNNPVHDNEPVAKVSKSIQNRYRSAATLPNSTNNITTNTVTTASTNVAAIKSSSTPSVAPSSSASVSQNHSKSTKGKTVHPIDSDDISVISCSVKSVSRPTHQTKASSRNNTTAPTETHVKTRYSQAFASSNNPNSSASTVTSSTPVKQSKSIAASSNNNTNQSNKAIIGDNNSVGTSSTSDPLKPKTTTTRRGSTSTGSASQKPTTSGKFEVPQVIDLQPSSATQTLPTVVANNNVSATMPVLAAAASAKPPTKTTTNPGNNSSVSSANKKRLGDLTQENMKAVDQLQSGQQPALSVANNNTDQTNVGGNQNWPFFGNAISGMINSIISSNKTKPVIVSSSSSIPLPSMSSPIRPLPMPPSTPAAETEGYSSMANLNLAAVDGSMIGAAQPLLQTPLFPAQTQPQSQLQILDQQQKQPFLQQQVPTWSTAVPSQLFHGVEIDPQIYASLTQEQRDQFHMQLQFEAQQQYYAAATAAAGMPLSPFQQPYVYFAQSPSMLPMAASVPSGTVSKTPPFSPPSCVFSSPTGQLSKPIVPTMEASTSPGLPEAPIAILQARSTQNVDVGVNVSSGVSLNGTPRSVRFPSADNLLNLSLTSSVNISPTPQTLDSQTRPTSSYPGDPYDSSASSIVPAGGIRAKPSNNTASVSMDSNHSEIDSSYHSGSDYFSAGPAVVASGSGGSGGLIPSPRGRMSKSPPRSRHSLSNSSDNLSFYSSNNGGNHNNTGGYTPTNNNNARTVISAFRSDRGLRDETILSVSPTNHMKSMHLPLHGQSGLVYGGHGHGGLYGSNTNTGYGSWNINTGGNHHSSMTQPYNSNNMYPHHMSLHHHAAHAYTPHAHTQSHSQNHMPSQNHSPSQNANVHPSQNQIQIQNQNQKLKIEKACLQYIQQIDSYIRSRSNFYAPGYVYPIRKIMETLQPPKLLITTTPSILKEQDLSSFIRFLKTYGQQYFHITSNRKAMELIHLTPCLDENIRCYGYYHCVNRYCDTYWESDASYAFEYQVCERCLTRVYPYQQDRLPDDYVPKKKQEEEEKEKKEVKEVIVVVPLDDVSVAAEETEGEERVKREEGKQEIETEPEIEREGRSLIDSDLSTKSVSSAEKDEIEIEEGDKEREREREGDRDMSVMRGDENEDSSSAIAMRTPLAFSWSQSQSQSLSQSHSHDPHATSHHHIISPGISLSQSLSRSMSHDESPEEDVQTHGHPTPGHNTHGHHHALQTIMEEPNGFNEEDVASRPPSRAQSQSQSQSPSPLLSLSKPAGNELISSSNMINMQTKRSSSPLIPHHLQQHQHGMMMMYRPIDSRSDDSLDENEEGKGNMNLMCGAALGESQRSPHTVLDVSSEEIHRMIIQDRQRQEKERERETGKEEGLIQTHIESEKEKEKEKETEMLSRMRSYSNEIDVERLFPGSRSLYESPSQTLSSIPAMIRVPSANGMDMNDQISGNNSGNNSVNSGACSITSQMENQSVLNSIFVVGNPLANPRRSSIVSKTAMPHTVDPDVPMTITMSIEENPHSLSAASNSLPIPLSLPLSVNKEDTEMNEQERCQGMRERESEREREYVQQTSLQTDIDIDVDKTWTQTDLETVTLESKVGEDMKLTTSIAAALFGQVEEKIPSPDSTAISAIQ